MANEIESKASFFLGGLLPIDRARLPSDIAAGLTLAALGIPEVMGYTKIAGTPVITGLYTLFLPIIVFALLGGSRHLVVAADSATAAILATTLVAAAPLGSPEYVGLTGVVALAVCGLLLLARLIDLGFLADFLSRSALIGFLSGVGIQVALSELPALFGLPKADQLLSAIPDVVRNYSSWNMHVAALCAVIITVLLVGSRVAPRIPFALFAVVGSIIASAMFDFSKLGIATLGSVPSGLPKLSLPEFRSDTLHTVILSALSCFFLIIAQSAATSRAYALRYDERFSDNADILGLAGANAAAAFSGTFVVNGSPTKTEMLDEAGGRSQVAHLTAAAVVLAVLLFFTGPLSFLPTAVLSAIVFVIGVKLVDIRGLKKLYDCAPRECLIALITAAAVVILSVTDGILLAIGLSLVDHVLRAYRPARRVLVTDGGTWRAVPVNHPQCAEPGVLVYRFESDLFYANANLFMTEALRLAADPGRAIRHFVVDASGIDDIDYTAARMLAQLDAEFRKRGIVLSLVTQSDSLRNDLVRLGLKPGEPAIHASLEDAISATRDPSPTREAPNPIA